MKFKLNIHEYRFDLVHEDEHEDCFAYEIQRSRLYCARTQIMKQSRVIDETAESQDEAFARKLDLQAELNQIKVCESRYARRWVNLSDAEKSAFKGGIRKGEAQDVQVANDLNQPPSGGVRLSNEISRVPPEADSLFDRLARLSSHHGSRFERLEIEIDWREQDTPLAESFLRLIKWMRKHRGKTAFEVEHRGPKSWTIESKLFALAVWRCSISGMIHSEIWDTLEPLRCKIALGGRNRRILGKYKNYIEKLVSFE